MKITIIQHSCDTLAQNSEAQYVPFNLGARIMATCVSNNPVETMQNEPLAKTLARREDTLTKRHHSGYDFETVALVLEDVTKIFCMYLNNLHVYSTEETSGRHKDLILPAKEKAVFDYFYEKVYVDLLAKNPDAEGDKATLRKFRQIARENARYTTGLDAKTNICYGVSIRQLNYICGWAEKFLDQKEYNTYEQLVYDDMAEFVDKIHSLEIGGERIIDPVLKKDPYGREFNLFGDFDVKPNYCGAVYETYYQASSTAFAQLQRHRQINYKIDNPDKQDEINYYIPDHIAAIDGLADEWVDKIDGLKNVSQARLLTVQETGAYEAIIARLKERACNLAQEETRKISLNIAYSIFTGMKDYDTQLSQELCEQYLNKNRCFFADYERCKCDSPCKKSDAIIFDIEQVR